MAFARSVCYVWQERNMRIFQNKQRQVKQVTRQIVQNIFCRCVARDKLARRLEISIFIRSFSPGGVVSLMVLFVQFQFVFFLCFEPYKIYLVKKNCLPKKKKVTTREEEEIMQLYVKAIKKTRFIYYELVSIVSVYP